MREEQVDLLRGGDEIAAFLFGNRGKRKQVYHLAEKAGLPVFKMGAVMCARKSTLLAWIQTQEQQASRQPERAA